MTMAHVPAVRRQSIRVALAATGVVAVAYLAISAAVVLFATGTLTSQIDGRLTQSFGRLPPTGQFSGGGPADPGHDPGRPFDAPFLAWTIRADGTVVTASTTPDLPAELYTVTAPQTATIGGTPFRVAGERVGSSYVVVAQAMNQVTDAQGTIILGELIIAPILLGLVFGGAVVVGRRVAAPIEAARHRQLEFTADASHELRTPLSVIEAHTSLALAQERDAAWYRNAFTKVERESKRMRRLLEDMLWLARFDAAQAPAAAGPMDLGVLATQAADRFTAVAETRHLALGVHVLAERVVIAAPAELVDRLVGVLVDNACKYAPDGGSVDVTVGIEGGRAFVAVDDSGPGIAEADRARIFDRFHRAVSTAGEAGGAGLGLAIGDAIVRSTSGRWGLGTSPAGGARFTVSWSRASLG
jgi:two-component system, OmpR family, sensor histidine kinase CiaH